MCGIVGVTARRNVTGILLEGLQRLEYRGYDSAGMAVIEEKNKPIRRIRAAGKVAELVKANGEAKLTGNTGIAHTRWATHGKPTEKNAHPHMSADKVALVHNGIIENYLSLREQLIADDYEFESETDTEVIVHLLRREIDRCGDFVAGVRSALSELAGSYAVAVMHADYPDTIVAVRVGSPLVVGVGIGEHFIASDPQALRPVTDSFIFLEEGELVEISADEISIFRLNSHGTRNGNIDHPSLFLERQQRDYGHAEGADAIKSRTVRIDDQIDSLDKRGFRHYMLKEIFEQPQTVASTLEERISKKHVLEAAFGVDAKPIFDQTKAVQIVACGSSYYTGMIARYWIEELAQIPCMVEIASEIRYRKVAVAPGTLFVTISQSGETADTLAALRDANDPNYLANLCICNVPNSSLVRESDLSLMNHVGPEIGVASTKAFTAQLVDLLLLSLILARRRGLNDEVETQLVTELHKLPDILKEVLKLEDKISKVAERFIEKEHALFLGRGVQYPVALEGALKLKEISYIHAEGYPAGELKHGPLALVDEEMPIIAIAPNDELLEKLRSNLQEVRARGGELFVFADVNSDFKQEEGCTVISIPSSHPMLAPIVYTLPVQLLAYHVGVLKGTDIDQPRNLAKSVTVE